MQCLAPGGPHWPVGLLDLKGGARVRRLWALGNPALLDAPPDRLVAIVGTREASGYGLRVARALAGALAEAGATVVSGLARGIDSAAHEAALEAGGATIAVQGTGADVPYPVGNLALHSRIAAQGLVISESPPGTKAFEGCFPRRNRIIAALARMTLVVEAGHKSGALNTAAQALELGRVVGAVPGMIDSPRAAGSNRLLRDGGHVIATVEDALKLVELSHSSPVYKPELVTIDAEVWDLLGLGDQLPEVLAERAGATLREIQGSVARLEVLGLVAVRADGSIGRAQLVTAEVI